jgi:fumarylacetoacetase
VSPWVVSLHALAPFRAPLERDDQAPIPLPYLASPQNAAAGAFDIQLQVWLETARMRHTSSAPQLMSQTSYRHAYWTLSQLVAHHTVNGCNLCPGDLLGTGTQSGLTEHELGSLVELSQGGKQPITVGGEPRSFLEDGDRVIFRAFCERARSNGQRAVRIGFGEVSAEIVPAHAPP